MFLFCNPKQTWLIEILRQVLNVQTTKPYINLLSYNDYLISIFTTLATMIKSMYHCALNASKSYLYGIKA